MVEARSRFWPLAAMVALIATLLYAPSWSYDYTELDDKELIVEQQSFLRQASSLDTVFGRSYFGGKSHSYYRPIVNLSFVIDAQWSGARPVGYHVTNTVLHAVASVLVLGFLLRLRIGEMPSLWGALWFAVHPVQAAAVAWIPGRNDVLLTVFSLGAGLLLMKDVARPGLVAKAGHLACLGLACLSKETALCLPLVLIFLLWATDGPHALRRQRWAWMGWIATIAAYLTTRFVVIGLPRDPGSRSAETAWRVLPVLFSDIGKLLLPLRPQVLAAPEDALPWPGVVVMGGVAILVWLGRGLRLQVVRLGLVLVLGPLLAGLLGAGWVVLENRLYLAVVGVSILCGEALRALAAARPGAPVAKTQSWHGAARHLQLGLAAITTVLCVLSWITLRHSSSFRDRDRFSQAAMAASPHSGLAAHLLHRRFLRDAGATSIGTEEVGR